MAQQINRAPTAGELIGTSFGQNLQSALGQSLNALTGLKASELQRRIGLGAQAAERQRLGDVYERAGLPRALGDLDAAERRDILKNYWQRLPGAGAQAQQSGLETLRAGQPATGQSLSLQDLLSLPPYDPRLEFEKTKFQKQQEVHAKEREEDLALKERQVDLAESKQQTAENQAIIDARKPIEDYIFKAAEKAKAELDAYESKGPIAGLTNLAQDVRSLALGKPFIAQRKRSAKAALKQADKMTKILKHNPNISRTELLTKLGLNAEQFEPATQPATTGNKITAAQLSQLPDGSEVTNSKGVVGTIVNGKFVPNK